MPPRMGGAGEWEPAAPSLWGNPRQVIARFSGRFRSNCLLCLGCLIKISGVEVSVALNSLPRPAASRRRGSVWTISSRKLDGDITHALSSTRLVVPCMSTAGILLMAASTSVAQQPAIVTAATTTGLTRTEAASAVFSPPASPSTPRACCDEDLRRSRRTTHARADRRCQGQPRAEAGFLQQNAQGVVESSGAGDPRSSKYADRRDAIPGRLAAGPLRLLLSRKQGHRVGGSGGRLGGRCRPAESSASAPAGPSCSCRTWSSALRAFPAGGGKTTLIGCSIDPTPEGLASMQNFLREQSPESRQ